MNKDALPDVNAPVQVSPRVVGARVTPLDILAEARGLVSLGHCDNGMIGQLPNGATCAASHIHCVAWSVWGAIAKAAYDLEATETTAPRKAREAFVKANDTAPNLFKWSVGKTQEEALSALDKAIAETTKERGEGL